MLNTVATIQQLFVYPVKSMRGVRLPDVFVSLNGIYGDRRYAFVQKRLADRSAFPWMTGREQPRLVKTSRPAATVLSSLACRLTAGGGGSEPKNAVMSSTCPSEGARPCMVVTIDLRTCASRLAMPPFQAQGPVSLTPSSDSTRFGAPKEPSPRLSLSWPLLWPSVWQL